MAVVLAALLAGLAALLTALLLTLSNKFGYWRRRGVPYLNPLAPRAILANGSRCLPWNQVLWQKLDEVYHSNRQHRFAGYFELVMPALVVIEPDLIKYVLIKDFTSFHDRGLPFDEENDPLSANLFNLGGDRWKFLRSKLTPTFTSGKIKLMYNLMMEISDELTAIVRKSAVEKEQVDFKSLLTRFTTDVIGSCAFGVNCNSLKDPNAEFYVMGQQAISSGGRIVLLRIALLSLFPRIFAGVLAFKNLLSKQTNFFINLMKETVDFRKKNDLDRNDFVKLMMQLKDSSPANKNEEFSDNLMVAQAFIFFVAGLDNVAYTIGFCLHELAHDEELQRRVAAEVREKVKEHGGELTYEALRDMHLLDRALTETLRMYSPVSILIRSVTRPLILPGTAVRLDAGTRVYIPVRQLHYDPAYYPDPERFDPDRFTEEARSARHPYVYLPFGEGPRTCIAERFARLEMQLALAVLLRDFHFSPAPGSHRRLQLNTSTPAPKPKEGFKFIVQERPL